jgi:hypothetical protein
MYSFFRLVFIFLGVWIVAALFNGFLCGVCLLLAQHDTSNSFSEAILCSFIFSLPFAVFVGLVTFVANCYGKKGFDLFQVTLAATFSSASAATLFFVIVLGKPFGNIKYAMGVSIIIAAIGAVMTFRDKLRYNE